MRKGYYAQMLFSKSGNLVAIATGSDATTEHELGSAPILEALTTSQGDEAAIVAALKQGKKVVSPLAATDAKTGLLEKLGDALNPPLVYPDLLETRRITKLHPNLQFVETTVDGQPEAWFGLERQPFPAYVSELHFNSFSSEADKNVAGAWDSRSFGFRVRGEKYVKALRGFYEAVKAGHVAFAGKFLTERAGAKRMSGVILANTKFISDEDRANIRKVQAATESSLRLKAKDDSTELTREIYGHVGENSHIGFIWVGWADKAESDVRYFINPGYQVKAEYGGPYTREQLLRWAKAQCSYMLKVNRQTEASEA